MKNQLFALAMSMLAPWLVVGVSCAESPCFEEIEQHYAWDDGGLAWMSLFSRPCPGAPEPASPAERATGGSSKILASGADAMVIEEDYVWAPRMDNPGAGGCMRFYKSITKSVRVAKNGRFHETTQVEDAPPKQVERALRRGEFLQISPGAMAPRPKDTSLQNLGVETIAGHPCQRVTLKEGIPGAGLFEFCDYVAPDDCRLVRYLQPLDLVIRDPNHKILIHGRTTMLNLGARGQVFAADAIPVD